MKRKHTNKPQDSVKIAKERITELFRLADKEFHNDAILADKYIQLARKISMKYKVPIPSELKRRFCKHCYTYLVPGVNSRVRLNKDKVVYSCFSCKKFMRYPHKKMGKKIEENF
jgi:ribonuclease P protein subunit RPR2